ncbi:Pre-mRNA-splicing factor rse-1 [Achaetomium macrosporum]|uniref:Pre-mRNA-splicing factor rse-1 n=1 Tax=Achaetomium macrosporum TaxID=79813 RepID=A0AAN7CHA3_9PEZI|nr:Pre-mRNA-splicing factor rse-1 [Achaetomium macrosporum]
MATTSNMLLYSLTLRPPTAITQAIVGFFSGTREQQILRTSGSQLSILRQDASSGKILPLVTQDLLGIIRSIAAFRLAGNSKDYILVATDSGRIAVIEYLPAQNRFSRVHLETFGRSGVCRVIPGQYLAADPKGRACIIASIERSKLVYVLNRNSQAELTISSPLEAHKSGVPVLSLVALDVGYANPVFASLETDYSGLDQDASVQSCPDVELVYYELDLGLNRMVRKWSKPVDPTSSLLFHVPGGNNGPSGVLVCGEERIEYRHSNQASFCVPIPAPESLFFLLQTEDGDLFKVTLGMQDDSDGNLTGEVNCIELKYFDTVPVATSLCILKSGFLFVAAEFGNHQLYRFEKLGDGEEVEFTSHSGVSPVFFDPRPLENLTLVESIGSMNPLLASEVAKLTGAEDVAQIYSVCGNGARSHFRPLRHGLEVSEIVASELPGTVSAVWTTKLTSQDEYDSYIILTSSTDTLVLSIGEEVKQVSSSGFLTSVKTLALQQIGDDSLVQVHPKGIRHIRNNPQIIEWPVPQHRSIVAAATNQRQIAVALSSGEIVYFEMDDSDGSLAEYDRREEMTGTVTCLGLGQVPKGRLRSSFLAVGCDDCTIRILSLEPQSTLESMSVQALTAAPSALSIISMEDSSSGSSSFMNVAKTTYLHIGLHSGVYLRTVLDEITGALTNTESKLLGVKAVKLFQVTVKRKACVLALSSKTSMGYVDPARGFLNFSSEQCQEGIIGVHANYLRIFSIENLHDNLVQRSIPLTYQPYFYTAKAENNTRAPELRAQLAAAHNSLVPPRGRGRWASCISIVDPIGEQVIQRIHLEGNEAATSLAVVSFTSQDNESFLIVGTGKDMVVHPRQFSKSYIYVYRFHEGGQELEFIHKTRTTEPPTALTAFRGRLAAGIGKTLLIYDLGLKQLLRKTQAEVAPNLIVSLQTQGNRIVVGDGRHGVSMMTYKPESNRLITFVDDTTARWTTCMTMVDYDSVAGGDRFGNLWIVRSPERASLEADEPGDHLIHAPKYLHSAPNRLDLMAHFFSQDIPTSISKTHLVVGGQEVLVWSGLQGTIGVLIPFLTREDADFFQTLEMHMRSEDISLIGRDHLMYRGYYVPVKGVIDGDLCERFRLLPSDKKQRIAAELDRSVREVEKKISDARTRSAF